MSENPEIIIDSGHGGKDPGGGSNHFWIEKELALNISIYQYKRFIELGIRAALTRSDDRYIAPSDRAAIVRRSGAKYCFSNHLNAGGGDGVETIHSIYSTGTLANKIASEIQHEGQNIRRVFTRKNDRGNDYYFMIRDTGNVETIIIEYGFADSKQDDVEQLREHWEQFAEAAVRAFCLHTGHSYSPPRSAEKVSPPAPVQKGPDYIGHWAEETIKGVIESKLMSTIDEKFAPDRAVTRAELAVVLDRAGLITGEDGKPMEKKDYAGHWAESAIDNVIAAGIMKGVAENTFAPDKPVTRAELAVVVTAIINRFNK